MKRQGRWEGQKELVERIARITTKILPEGEGVALRFINREVDNSSNLSLEQIGAILDPMPWQPGGDTNIGTYLRSKILVPLVYDKIRDGVFDRPVLVSIMTDGMPSPEKETLLGETIEECVDRLQRAGYPHDSKHMSIHHVHHMPRPNASF